MGDDLESQLKEPTAGTSRSLMDIDAQPLMDNDFGGSGFGRTFHS